MIQSTPSCVKHGEGNVMIWACMAANRSMRMNSKVYRVVYSTHMKPNSAKLIGQRSTVQMNNDPKNTVKSNSRSCQETETGYSSLAHDFRQSLIVKHVHPSIKNNPFIHNYVN